MTEENLISIPRVNPQTFNTYYNTEVKTSPFAIGSTPYAQSIFGFVRAFGVEYPNPCSYAMPITVKVAAGVNPIDVEIAVSQWGFGTFQTIAVKNCADSVADISAIIPAGWWYKVIDNSGVATIDEWIEFYNDFPVTANYGAGIDSVTITGSPAWYGDSVHVVIVVTGGFTLDSIAVNGTPWALSLDFYLPITMSTVIDITAV